MFKLESVFTIDDEISGGVDWLSLWIVVFRIFLELVHELTSDYTPGTYYSHISKETNYIIPLLSNFNSNYDSPPLR